VGKTSSRDKALEHKGVHFAVPPFLSPAVLLTPSIVADPCQNGHGFLGRSTLPAPMRAPRRDPCHNGPVANNLPGWYPDPWRLADQRWWDGAQWTPYVSTSPALAPWAGSLPGDVLAAQANAESKWKWGRVAIFLFAAYLILEAVSVLVSGSIFGSVFHQITINSQANATPNLSAFSSDPVLSLFIALVELALIPFVVMFMIWQYNAAKVARVLGYPSRLSPGLGVGSWFIPIVALWFPHWALSDLLPPEHPMRRKALWAWWAYVLNPILLFATLIAAFGSTAAALIPLGLSVVLILIAIKLGLECFNAVQEDHRQRLNELASPARAPNSWGSPY
jgi:Domain of unknown function (DUF4328)/Protein of unknown function (DUF2510)